MKRSFRLLILGIMGVGVLGLATGCGAATSSGASSKGLPSSLSTGAQ